MLYESKTSDTDAVRAWLNPAVAAALKAGVTKAEMAAACGATPQAFNGWLKTGRITKANLSKAVVYFGSAPNFTNTERTAGEASPDAWPFRKFSAAQVATLPDEARNLIEELTSMIVKSAKLFWPPERKPAPGPRNGVITTNYDALLASHLRASIITTLEEAASRKKQPRPDVIAKIVLDRLNAIYSRSGQNSESTATKESSRSDA